MSAVAILVVFPFVRLLGNIAVFPTAAEGLGKLFSNALLGEV